MKLVELTKTIVEQLVSDKESVSVKEFPSENAHEIIIQVMVLEADMGRVIGKGGNIANALRCIVRASSYMDDNKKVIINIDSY